jgi:hypothetical protein
MHILHTFFVKASSLGNALIPVAEFMDAHIHTAAMNHGDYWKFVGSSHPWDGVPSVGYALLKDYRKTLLERPWSKEAQIEDFEESRQRMISMHDSDDKELNERLNREWNEWIDKKLAYLNSNAFFVESFWYNLETHDYTLPSEDDGWYCVFTDSHV